MQVIKRDGRVVEFDENRIRKAISKASFKTGEDISEEEAEDLSNKLSEKYQFFGKLFF